MNKELGKLNRIELAGYKSIRRMDLEMMSLNVLIGANGSGKSNFISFFRMMNHIVNRDFQSFVAHQRGADKLFYFGRKQTREITTHLRFKPNGYFCCLKSNTAGGLFFEEEYCEFFGDEIGYGGGEKKYPLAEIGARETALPKQPNLTKPPGHVTGYLRDWKVYHFHDTSESSALRRPARTADNDYLHTNGENLPAFLYLLQEAEPQAFQEIEYHIERIAPFFQGFDLRPDRANEEQIRLRWKHHGTDRYFDAVDLSDGTLRFIALTTLLLQPDPPSAIILDEPELGLHPFAIHLLADMMRSVSDRTQIIAATQSVTFANQFNWPDLVVVDREKQASSFRRLSEDEVKSWMDDYAMGDLWEKNLIGGRPR